MIGEFGEYFASRWLTKQGFEVRGFWNFYLKLKFGTHRLYEIQAPLPEDERRRRGTQSLETRIPILDKQLAEVSAQANPSRKVKVWIVRESEHLRLMKQALADLKEGKPLDSIHEYPTEFLLNRNPPERWQLYDEVATESDAREFLGPSADAFMNYLEECEIIAKTELGGTMSPDILAKKDGKIYVVEVKANQAVLQPLQRRALDLAAKYGFQTKVIRVKFDAHCSEEAVWKRRPRVNELTS